MSTLESKGKALVPPPSPPAVNPSASNLLNPGTNSGGSLKITGIELLSSPGAESNYIDWSFVVKLFLEHSKVSYVLFPVALADRPASWADDNLV